MEVKIDKSFQKDVKKIKDRAILKKIADSIINAQRFIHLPLACMIIKIKE